MKKFNTPFKKEVTIPAAGVNLLGNLVIPEKTQGIVLFVHGSGSSRHSPRNNYVADALNKDGLATLLFDLLTAEEEAVDIYTREYRFDIELLAQRLIATTDWVAEYSPTEKLPIGYFGSSTGAAAALIAAAECPDLIKAVVSRGGRPDLAGPSLGKVHAPTLLIVGGNDFTVLDLNKAAQAQMHAENKLAIVPGATHLFEEPGTLDQVIQLASQWFRNYLKYVVQYKNKSRK